MPGRRSRIQAVHMEIAGWREVPERLKAKARKNVAGVDTVGEPAKRRG